MDIAQFPAVWSLDSEWGFRSGRVDCESAWEPVCLCAVELHCGKRVHFVGRDSRLSGFFIDHAHDLFLAHYAIAEMKYLLRLGVMLPAQWYDTFVAERLLTNAPGLPEAGLSASLIRRGLPHLAPAEKHDLQQQILHLRFNPNDSEEMQRIIDYCYTDCDGCLALFRRQYQEPQVLRHMGWWTEYLKAVARMELRGIPFDVAGYEQIRRAWPHIRMALIEGINKTHPVFDGLTFKKSAFMNWCRRENIRWPLQMSETTGLPYHPLDEKTFKAMEPRNLFIADVRQVRKSMAGLGRRALVVDAVLGRHCYGASAFRSVSGRNQPRKFVFGGPKWMRFLIVPESPDHVLVNVDFTAQEIGIAAALSGDGNMRSVYEASDCHMAFAIRAGAAPTNATKATNPDVRKLYKAVNLGVLYGQSAFGIASRLAITERQAEALLRDHRALFPKFWEWSDHIVQGSIDRGWIVTPCGWRSQVPPAGNVRTWMNWPMQATGADIMRLTVIYLDRQNVRLLAPIHDGFLISCRRDQIEDARAAVDYACAKAVEHVLPGFPLRWDVAVYERRYEDDAGRPLWDKLQDIMSAPS